MIEVRQTAIFAEWLAGLADRRAQEVIAKRLVRVQSGNLGDVTAVGEGVSEMRVFYGPGYRLYFVRQGRAVVILLCGGDKGSQERDIRRAKELAKEL